MEEITPPVTWLLAVKDGMPYLPETLASIEAQTYRNWQILAWDNGSTDDTLEELHRWIPSRLPGRIVSNRPLGLGASLAEIIKEADTELCARIDADDVNFPQRLEVQVAFLVAHPEVAVVGSQAQKIDANGLIQEAMFSSPRKHDDIVIYLLGGCSFCHPTVLLRRSAVLEAGNYRDVGPVNVEDYDLWTRLAVRFKLANLDATLLNYRVHARSVTSRDAWLLGEAGRSRFYENGPALFGLSAEQAKALQEQRHPCTIALLYRALRYVQRAQGGSIGSRLRSPWFLLAAHRLTPKRDILSRLLLSYLDADAPSVASEIKAILRDGISRLRKHANI